MQIVQSLSLGWFSATTTLTFSSIPVKFSELWPFLYLLRKLCCGGHFESSLLQNFHNCRFTSDDYFLQISLQFVQWVFRYFANSSDKRNRKRQTCYHLWTMINMEGMSLCWHSVDPLVCEWKALNRSGINLCVSIRANGTSWVEHSGPTRCHSDVWECVQVYAVWQVPVEALLHPRLHTHVRWGLDAADEFISHAHIH